MHTRTQTNTESFCDLNLCALSNNVRKCVVFTFVLMLQLYGRARMYVKSGEKSYFNLTQNTQ